MAKFSKERFMAPSTSPSSAKIRWTGEQKVQLDIKMSEEATWQSMGLDARVLRAINKLNWNEPSPAQQAAIPYALEGKDVLVKAKTGSGKTAAYAVPIVQKLLNKKEVCNS